MSRAAGYGLAAALLVLVAAALAAGTTSLSRISRVRVEELVQARRRGAGALARVVRDPARYLNIVTLVRVGCELTATVLVAVALRDGLPARWQAVVTAAVAMTLVDYLLIGVAARTIGRDRADFVALRLAAPAVALNRVLGPLPVLLIWVGNLLTPGRALPSGPFTSEAELRDLIDVAEERQVIEESEREMLHSVFELADTIVREIMVPRTDMVWIERTKTVRQGLSLSLRSGFSRIPVVGENEDDVVGIVYLRDLARRMYGEDDRGEKVEEIMRPPYFVPESKPVDELLREMQAQQVHIAVVIDEYGGTAGLVTIEDVLEEIVGEIADEHDREPPRVEEVDESTLRVNVRLPVDELEEIYGVSLELDDVETVGGLLAAALGRVPIPGATATLQGLTFVAESGKGRRNRIGTVLIRRESPGEQDAEVAASDG